MSVRRFVPCCLVVVWSTLVGSRGAERDPEVDFADTVLKEKGVATDGPALLAYFKARTLSQEDLDRLAATVAKLGDNDFEAREKASRDLVAAGRPALTFLKNALTSTDPEIARRARLCLDEIEANRTAGLTSAPPPLPGVRPPRRAPRRPPPPLPPHDHDVVRESVVSPR